MSQRYGSYFKLGNSEEIEQLENAVPGKTDTNTQGPSALETIPNNVVVELTPEMLEIAQLYAQYRRMTTDESVNVILRIRFYKAYWDLIDDPDAQEAMNKIAPGVADRILDLSKRRRPQIQSVPSVASKDTDSRKVEVERVLAEFARLYAGYAFRRDKAEVGSSGELGISEAVNAILALFLEERASELLDYPAYRAEMDADAPGIADRIIQLGW